MKTGPPRHAIIAIERGSVAGWPVSVFQIKPSREKRTVAYDDWGARSSREHYSLAYHRLPNVRRAGECRNAWWAEPTRHPTYRSVIAAARGCRLRFPCRR
jgi:hypothetical protein